MQYEFQVTVFCFAVCVYTQKIGRVRLSIQRSHSHVNYQPIFPSTFLAFRRIRGRTKHLFHSATRAAAGSFPGPRGRNFPEPFHRPHVTRSPLDSWISRAPNFSKFRFLGTVADKISMRFDCLQCSRYCDANSSSSTIATKAHHR